MVEVLWKGCVLASVDVSWLLLLRRRSELRCRSDELACASELPGALGAAIGEQAVVADAVEALGQDVHEEAANELAGLKRHGRVPFGTVDAIILVSVRCARRVGQDAGYYQHPQHATPEQGRERFVAACTVIARFKGNWGTRDGYSKKVDSWVQTNPTEPSRDLVQLALRAIDRIVTAPSELMELWGEARTGPDRHATVADLRERVAK